MPSTRSRKRQTRLAFTPVPSSSPQAANLPSSLRSRAAVISYDGVDSPTKRRKFAPEPSNETPTDTVHFHPQETPVSNTARPTMFFSPFARKSGTSKRQSHLLPTPEASSQVRNDPSGMHHPFLDRKPLILTGEIASTADFQARPASGDSDSSLPSVRTLITTPRKQQTTPSKLASSLKGKGKEVTEDDEEEDDILPARLPRSEGRHYIIVSSDDDSDEDIEPLSSPQRPKPSKIIPVSTPQKREVVTPSKPKEVQFSPRRTRSSGKAKAPLSTNGSTRRSTRLQSREIKPEPDDDESTTTPIERSSQTIINSGDESDVFTPTRSRRKGKHPRRLPSDLGESETSGDVERSPTKKSRLSTSLKESPWVRRFREQDKEDLDEDLEILRDTGTVTRIYWLPSSFANFRERGA